MAANSEGKPKNSGSSAFLITGKIFKKFRKKTESSSSASPTPLKVGVFGASGPTGQCILSECLERSYEVVAFVRNEKKITIQNEKLQVVKADVFKEDELVPHLTGCDAILSALGATGMSIFSKVTLYEESMKSITSAMRKASVSRLVCLTAWYTKPDEETPKLVQWFIKPFLIGRVLVSMGEMEKYLQTECDDIKYTIVRPAMLGNGPATDQEVKAVEGQFVPESTGKIGRRDVAKFLIDCLTTDQWDNKAVAIGI